MTVPAAANRFELERCRSPFAEAALELRKFGLCPIPVGGDNDKTPLVTKYTTWSRRPGAEAIKKWSQKYPNANIGIACGQSGVTIIDIDDPSVVDDMVQRFGETPLITKTPSGGFHLWYRSNGEKDRNLRRYGFPVDVKSTGGFVVVPPSVRRSGEHAGRRYEFHSGSWMDLRRLPCLDPGSQKFDGAKSDQRSSAPDARVTEGSRNDTLFLHAKSQVRHCGTRDDLWDVARTRNLKYEPPLSEREVEKIVSSVWGYHERGEIWERGDGPTVIVKDDELAILEQDSDACLLYLTLKANHGARKEPFAIAPEEMAAAGVIPAFKKSHARYRKGRNFLDENGLLRKIHHGKGRKMLNGKLVPDPHLFTFSSTPPLKSGGNITKTPAPPWGWGSDKQ